MQCHRLLWYLNSQYCEIQKGTSSLKTAGRIYHFEYYYIPITNENGEVVELVGMYVNVTDQRKLLTQLEKSITELLGCLAALADSDLTKLVLLKKQ